ncbi:lauroyl/myristoyl acyltransferase [Azoarcus sp. KH32C]|uniref:LpxL/LpxP family acyltransferase n=1 Tax=Azoarcus sp. KH32C TaxID=748247 RepID=UPI0002386283|nr:lauroyl/myristoyl acyltransferase [Azoarcus sp. KH32C]BAL24093.1 putative lauroyl/myristoyl acyltransferase [Azoarcus sp. KH32C]
MSRPSVDVSTRRVQAEWAQKPERSNQATLRLMTCISLRLGRRTARVVLWLIATYFLAFSPTARRESRNWLQRVLGRRPSIRDLLRHFFTFASTIHDRVYLVNDRDDLFDIHIHGGEEIRACVARGEGVLLMGAHLGSFEVLRTLGRHGLGARVAMVMYEENARKVNETLAAINPAAHQDIIPLGRLESMLQVKERLDDGSLVGILADRSLDQDGTAAVDFFGSAADFPLGPWRMAAMMKRPVFLMVGLYRGGNRYDLHFEQIADFSTATRDNRSEMQRVALLHYVGRLEHYARSAPYNWFNFFDFWQSARSREAR